MAIVIFAALATCATCATLKTLAYNKGKLSFLSNFALAKTPFKA